MPGGLGLLALDREVRCELLTGAAASALAAWGLRGARVQVLEQKTGITFRVDAQAAGGAEPQRFLLRVWPLGAYERHEIASEGIWLLALRRDGLVVPEPVPTLDGSLVMPAFLPEWGGSRWCVLYRWVPGTMVEADVTPELIEQVGELAGRIHNCAERFVPPPEFSRPRWDCDRLFGRDAVIPAGKGEPLITARLREILDAAAREVRREIEALGEGPEVFGIIHKDLEPDNTVLDEGRVHAIDFADCGWGWYLYDMAASLLPLREKKGFPELRAAFLRGYRRHRPLSARHEELLETFLIARSLFTIRFMVLTSLEQRPELQDYADRVIPMMAGEIRRFLERRTGAAARPGEGARAERTTIIQFLGRLRDLGIKLWAEGEKLRFSAPQGALTPELRAELADRKPEVLAFLRQGQDTGRTPGPTRRVAPAAGPVPLSFAQQRLWFLDQLHPGSPEYNIARAVRLTGDLRVDVLARSLNEVIRRHAVLRTTFALVGREPRQIVAPALLLPLPVVDLRALPEGERLAETQRIIDSEGQRPFDLERGPLARISLLRLADRDHLAASTMHHIISDGWSTGLLFREMGLLYAAFLAGGPSPLQELPLQYTDFSWWQREVLEGEALAGQLAWWKEQLAGAPDMLELPADRPRAALRDVRGGKAPVELPAELTQRLRELGQAEGATPFMVLFAAWNALLARTAGQDDIVLGIPIANRNRTEIEPLIGFFVNTLALRTRLEGDPAWRELLGRVRRTTLGAYSHQDLPFENLVAELRPNRSEGALAGNPLFQVMFALQAAQREESLSLPGLTMGSSSLGMSGGPAKFDLTLSLQDGEGGVKGSLEYRAELFDAATIARLLEHWRVLLDGVAADPDLRLSEMPLLRAAERHQVLVAWSDTAGPDPARCLHEIFAERARARPEAVAVSAADAELTYGELRARAGRLAANLRRLGVGPDTAVGLCLERSARAVTALLAVLEAGGAFVPLDPSYPAERLAHMAADAGVRLVLTEARLRDRLPELERVLLLEEAEAGDAHPAPAEVQPDHLAYIMFTSGSTGRPKGVAVTHRAVARLVLGANFARLGPDEAVLQYAPLSFDASTLEIWGCLLHGGRLVVVPAGQASPEELGHVISGGGVTTLWLTAGLFHRMVEDHPEGLGEVRQLLAGGDVLSPEHVRRILERVPGLTLVNGYGPTENTTFTSCHRMTAPGQVESPVPIGRPITGTRIVLLDRWLAPAPVGVTGELHAAGHGLARGYAGRPDLTAERFVPHPCPAVPGERLYRTGDLARWRPDGTIEFLGRRDRQVKVRGFRIEPGEIESALAALPGVREAVVLVREEVPGDKRLTAYLVPAGDAPAVAGLREALRQVLPDWMVPSAFVTVDALPLGATGKVDRRALARLGPEPETLRPEAAGEAFEDPVEEILAGIFAEVLRAGRVGREDDFFATGGHSLLATQVVSRVRETLRVELSLQRLFETPTVAGLAAAVREGLRRELGPEAPPIVPVPRDRDLPLSFAQQRLWFLDRLQPGGSAYNVPGAVRLTGRLAPGVLERAAREVVQRHEALRTTFTEGPAGPVQVISPEARLALPLVDLSLLSRSAREAEARRLAAAEALRPFDLAAGPLLRMTLLRLDAAEHVALVTFHHVVADGWSMGVFLNELAALYASFSRGGPSLAPLAVHYADFAVWQRSWLEGGALAEQLDWWRRRLAGAPEALELPTDRPWSAVRTSRRGELHVQGGAALTGRLRALARAEGATPFMLLLAAWNALLARVSGQDDVVVGIPIANRNRRETEGLIGFFVNTLALRTDLTGDPVWSDLLGRVRAATLGAYAHQDLPFETLVAELRPQRPEGAGAPAANPLFQVAFAFRSERREPFPALPGLAMRPLQAAGEGTAKFDLTLSLVEGEETLQGSLEYRAELFDRATIARLLEHWQVLLEGVAAGGARLSDLPLLREPERHQLLVAWNDTAGPDPSRCLHELFAEQARRRPDAVAVSAPDGEFTYGELRERAGRLAAALLGLGVGPDAAVGLCLERSARALTALLAVLEAGGAFVPLDPSYPAERLRQMAEDAGVRLVLGEERLRGELPEFPGVELILLEDLERGSDIAAPPRAPALPDHLAYVMFTSGSTGRPKGVAVTHRAVARLVLEANYVRFGPGETLLQLAPLSFDASTLEIWGCLLHGGRLVVPPAGPVSLEDLGRIIAAGGVTTLWLTAGLFHQMVESHPEGLRPVRQLLAGGDVLSPDLVRRILARAPGARLINGYGPTENTTFTCCHGMGSPDEVESPVPIGRPITGTRVVLLDRWRALAPVGVVGELHAAGHGLARGYAGRPDLTAERFVPHPCPKAPGERLYSTGDLARWRPDGRLEFLGRRDQQVKIRGFRIELGEIEAALTAVPGVREAAALVHTGSGDKRLAACVAGDAPDAAALRGALREALPDYMIPSVFVFVDALPLGPTGKVDRGALARLLAAAPSADPAPPDTAAAPLDPVEELLAGIWAGVLRVGQVGREDDFFALGGHSLLATQVVSRVREAFGVELPLPRIFETPTVAALAEAVRELLRAGHGAEAPPIVPAPRGGALPLSFAQQRLWFLDRLQPGGSAYNVPAALRLRGALLPAVLSAVFGEVARRHEVLRTTFAEWPGGPVQRISPEAPVELSCVDLAVLPPEVRERAVRRLGAAEAARPFDLAAGPVLRATLVRLAGDDHVLLVTLHHIVADGWSTGVLFREMGALYSAFSRGVPSPLAPLPVQYADFAVWQRGWLAGEVLQAELEHWRERLAGAQRSLALPLDRPRPAVQTFRGGARERALPADLRAAVEAFARRAGATPFMVLLAAWQALLGRVAGQEDLLVGTPIAGRNRREIEGLIGFFVNTLALRGDLTGDPGLGELVTRARAAALDAFAHQDLPLERLVEELQPERDLSQHPLFQVVFAVQNTPVPELSLPGLALAALPLPARTAKFDLTLALSAQGDGLAASLEHNADLFDGTTAERLLGRFAGLLAAALRDPGAPLSALPLLEPAELHQVLVEWNDTPEADGLVDLCVHERVALWAVRTPDAPALVQDGRSMTYGELSARAGQLARRLAALGVGPEVVVGVCLERSLEEVTALLAILAAGGAYLPLDPSYPPERLAFLVEDSGARVVITAGAAAAAVPVTSAARLELDREALVPRSAGIPGRGVDPGHLAYVIYTSGSTGRPKGVQVEHRTLQRLVAWHLRAFAVTPHDRAPRLAGLAFDASVWELWPYLGAGASVYIPPEAARTDPSALRDWLLAEGITFAFVPTPLAEALLALDWPLDAPLRALLTGGDKLHRRPAPGLPFRLVNNYGPTECTVVSTSGEVPAGPAADRAPAIGRPIDGVRAVAIDRHLRPVPIGVAGELCVGGGTVTRGYRGRPDLTAERFVPDPFGPPGGRMYRTGDLVRRLADGEFEFLGRSDDQVKIRGFRIEPGEVEAALAACPGVSECAVVACNGTGGARLVAFVAGTGAPGADVLRAHLRGLLPDYMVPTAFVPLAALPLTPNGKVDRRALVRTAPAPAGGTGPLQDPVEELLAGIWREVLRTGRIGRGDDFFAIGGHSLLATQVVSRVREACGVELPLQRLFEAPTLAGLAAVVRETLQAGHGLQAPPVTPVPHEGRLPLSFAQQRLWFLDQLQPGSPAYNIPAAVLLRGDLDVPVLAAALREIVRRHAVLRTTIAAVDGEPVQLVAPVALLPLPCADLRGLPEPAREAEARRLAAEESRRPFDLEAGPLVRASLLRLRDDEHVALLTFHHIVADGWSIGVFLGEVASLYTAFSAGDASPLPGLPVQYADFAVWQRRWLAGDVLAAEIGVWRRLLGPAPGSLELPTDRPRQAVQTFAGREIPVALGSGVSDGVAQLARREGATPFMALLAVFQILLSRLARQEDVTVGTPIAGRNRRETEGLIGFFVNTLVLAGDLRGDPTVRELLERVRCTALEAYAHQDVPFEYLVEELQPQRDLSSNPLFQVLFALQNTPRDAFELPGLTLVPVETASGTAKFDLSLALREEADGLRGSLEYSTDLFDAATPERWMRSFQVLLEEAVADSGRRIADLPWLDAAERRQVLLGWNATGSTGPADLCLQRLIEAQAARTPDALALVSGGRTLSYHELETRADRLAEHLRGLGVGPEERVGVCLERGIDLVVALLAVLKAGGAYVPLDPSYPPERLAFMLRDAEGRVLLTQEPLLPRLPSDGIRLLCLDRDLPAAALPAPVWRAPGPGNLAYVIYTSGSTGVPKGVAIEHRSAVAMVRWARGVFTDGELAGVLAATSVCFDLSVFEIFVPLAWGGCVILVENALALSRPEPLPEGVEIRLVNTVPSAMAELVRLDALPSTVRTVNLAGEALPSALVERIYRTGTVRAVYNLYGPSEDTTYSTFARMDRGSGEPPIGCSLTGTRAYVLDGRFEPVPVGVPGELWLAGEGLARGYLGRPEKTAESFLPDPFSGAPGARLYRTGDLVRLLPAGDLSYLGRIDHQVKVRGFRIELGEIEAELLRDPRVRETVVVARGEAGDRRLVAYVVAEGEPSETGELREGLRQRLPEHMIPAVFVLLPALPRTPNGKVDRRALPEPEQRSRSRGAVPPRDAIELQLVRIWEELLGVEPVGAQDDFFALGGHSLLAVRLVGRIRERFGRAIPLTALFQGATVESLAALLRRELGPARRQALVPIRPRGGRRPLFLVHPIGGNVLCYADLARRLDPEQPLFGLQVPDPEDGRSPAATIEEMAARYLEAARTIHPPGPWRLGGWSLGGVVAFEMARQLEAEGEEVEMLAVIDAAVPGAGEAAVRQAGDPVVLFARDLAGLLGIPPGDLAGLDLNGGGPEELLARWAGAGPAAEIGEDQLRALFNLFRANLEALGRYVARPSSGRMTLFRTAESAGSVGDPTLGWNGLAAGGLEIVEIPGSHYNLLRTPHVEALASRLGGQLLDGGSFRKRTADR